MPKNNHINIVSGLKTLHSTQHFCYFCNTVYDWSDVLECSETQLASDMFYELILKLFNDFYPLKTITTTNRDPDFITPEIKSLLRKNNKLIRHNQIKAANAIAQQIRIKIQKRNASSFTKPCKDTKELWKRVNKITGKSTQGLPATPNTNADQLNAHYAHISTDSNYVEPSKKHTWAVDEGLGITEYQISKCWTA